MNNQNEHFEEFDLSEFDDEESMDKHFAEIDIAEARRVSHYVMPNYGLPLSGHIKKEELNSTDQTKRFVGIMENYYSSDERRQAKARNDVLAELDALIKRVLSRHYSTYRAKYGADLYTEGVIAIYQALPDYDPLQSSPSVYFYLPIKHAMQVYVAENVHHVSRHYADMMTKLKKAAAAMRTETGSSEISAAKLSTYTGISLSTVLEALRQEECSNTIPYDIENESAISVQHERSPIEYIIEKERNDVIAKALDTLEPLEARILCLCSGYGDEISNVKGKAPNKLPTELQIANYLKPEYPWITSSHVHRMYNIARQKMRVRPELKEYASVPYDTKKRRSDENIPVFRRRTRNFSNYFDDDDDD